MADTWEVALGLDPTRNERRTIHALGDGTFADVSAPAGLGSLPVASRRGVAFGDLDNDGDIDIVMLNLGGPPTLLRNRQANRHHRVQFKLVGTKSNRAGIGARVVVRAGDLIQFDEVRSGSSYLSQNDLRLHFGLGERTKIDSVEIRWPSGAVDHLPKLEVDHLYTVVEGKGIRQAMQLPHMGTTATAPKDESQRP